MPSLIVEITRGLLPFYKTETELEWFGVKDITCCLLTDRQSMLVKPLKAISKAVK